MPGPDRLGELLRSDPSLLELTFDQLRTLLLVRHTGSALRAAQQLGREQSSVQKQLDTLNRHFQRLVGELLVVKQGRGKDVLLTPTGRAITALAEALFADWTADIQDSRRRLGRTLTVGTTEFTLGYLGRIWPRVRDQPRPPQPSQPPDQLRAAAHPAAGHPRRRHYRGLPAPLVRPRLPQPAHRRRRDRRHLLRPGPAALPPGRRLH